MNLIQFAKIGEISEISEILNESEKYYLSF